MIWIALIGAALAGRWDEANADVSAWREIPAPADAIYRTLSDLHALEGLFPPSCAQDWAHGEITEGIGASASVTYRWDVVRRRLHMTLTQAERDRWIDLDHEGPKGFVTRFAIEGQGASSKVEVTSYINPPPWPLQGRYFLTIQPIWTNCYVELLQNLEQQMAATVRPPPVRDPLAQPKPPPSIRGATWVSPACEGRSYVRRINIQQDFTYTGIDLVAPCPPTARCSWSGVVHYAGQWQKEEGAYALREAESETGKAGAPHPTRLYPGEDGLHEGSADGACVYELLE
ncbi:MAG: SRPBCC family protein [Deltaproteobacteria bacterium]|nr:SRPBCC family protein [Deltaproteobacteria bacterium]